MADAKAAKSEKVEGPRTYILTEKFYKLGVMHMPGETITIGPDEKPGKSWVLATEAAAPKVFVPAATGRASDKEI